MRNFLLSLFIFSTLMSGCSGNKQEAEKSKPNILLMVADDMGYADLGCYGGLSRTPNLDMLAGNGALFTNFYSAAPNCSPSRVGLMTGKSPSLVGMYSYRPPEHQMHLRDEEVTIAEVLEQQGYNRAHFGKWHLGCLPQDSLLNHPQPHDQGFEYSLGTENNSQPSHLNPVNFVRNGEKLPEQKGYSCQIVASEAISWMDQRPDKSKPFFGYVAFHEPHRKVASPPELVSKYSDFPTMDAEYLANVENLDLAVGNIVKYLKENKLFENTLILFASDNGSYRQASNGELRAVKSYTYDGGIRVPGIIHWPALEKKNMVIDKAAGFVDIMPTICDILQIEPPNKHELDGTSILTLLNGQKINRKKPLFWYFYRTSPEIAVRVGDVMILGKDSDTIPRTHRFSSPDMSYIKNMDLAEYELYDLASDKGQYKNIIDSHPKSAYYKEVVDEKLREIQLNGYLWNDLPDADGQKRVKTNWVKYQRE
ncbi:MAG: sulfatase-like hydrolase/transferase [Cyclobacteriaceae bacterium]